MKKNPILPILMFLFTCFALCTQPIYAQNNSNPTKGKTKVKTTATDDNNMLDDDEDEPQLERVKNAFKSSRVINGHSMEMIGHGTLDFRILHRFGLINRGLYELFGLDQASMRMGFDYGVLPNLTVGIGRATVRKESDAFIKYRLLWQSKGAKNIPVSLVWVSGITCSGLKWSDPERDNYFSSRLGYYHSLIIGRKFNERLSLQISPTLVHRNLVAKKEDGNDIYAIGLGGRVKLTRRITLNVDYHHALNGQPKDENQNPLSIGFDIETGGHVFQLHFSNAVGMNERTFITETNNDFFKGDIQFGFNLSRIFQVHSPKKLK